MILKYMKDKNIVNAYVLSRLLINSPDCEIPARADVLSLKFSNATQLNSELISVVSRKYPKSSRVALMITNGLPLKINNEQFKSYFC